MNNENNVNATQNPNVTNTVPEQVPSTQPTVPATPTPAAPATGEGQSAGTNNLQTIVVPSGFPDEAPATTANVAMPGIVNPLEVKADEVKPEVQPAADAAAAPAAPAVKPGEEQPKQEKVSEYQERLRKAQENYKPPSKFKMFINIFWLVLVILFGMFIPEISTGINKFLDGPVEGPEPDPTTGTLVCTLDSYTSNLDKGFRRSFSYEDNKLKSAVFQTSIRGDATSDEKTLDELYNNCKTIENNVKDITGIKVTCKITEGLVEERESFDYSSYDIEAITAAYTEAGSSVVEFDYDADIDEIMKSMRQAGFTCNKEKPKNE